MANPQIVSFIRTAQARGSSRAVIQKALEHKGWQAGDISAAFAEASRPVAQARPAAAVSSAGVDSLLKSRALVITVAVLLLIIAGVIAVVFVFPSDSAEDLECESDGDCGRGEICEDNECVDEEEEPECEEDEDCGSDEICNDDGECEEDDEGSSGAEEGSCTDDDDCDSGEVCTDDFACEDEEDAGASAECSDDDGCDSGEYCGDDSACAVYTCMDGEDNDGDELYDYYGACESDDAVVSVCEDEDCETDCEDASGTYLEADDDCSDAESNEEGEELEDCGAYEEESDGSCLTSCASDSDCVDAYGCNEDSACVLECTEDDDCGLYLCYDEDEDGEGLCLVACTDNDDCGGDYECDSNACKLACTADDECGGYSCGSDDYCETSCSKSSDCADGYTCGVNDWCIQDEASCGESVMLVYGVVVDIDGTYTLNLTAVDNSSAADLSVDGADSVTVEEGDSGAVGDLTITVDDVYSRVEREEASVVVTVDCGGTECSSSSPCVAGYDCSDEVCVSSYSLETCEESDEGYNVTVAGYGNGTWYEDGVNYTELADVCTSGGDLVEVYCAESGEDYAKYLVNETVSCDSGYECVDGACEEEEATTISLDLCDDACSSGEVCVQGTCLGEDCVLQVTDDVVDQRGPALFNTTLVWLEDGDNDGEYELVAYDLEGDIERQIGSNSISSFYASYQLPPLYGRWVLYNTASAVYAVELDENLAGDVSEVALDSGNGASSFWKGDVFQDTVVWYEYDGVGYYDIYMEDLSGVDGGELRVEDVGTSPAPQYNGEYLVWIDKNEEGYFLTVEYGDGTTDTIVDESNIIIGVDLVEDYVVWSENRDGSYDVYYEDLSDGVGDIVQLTDHSSSQSYPQVSEDYVLWYDGRGVEGEIYAYSFIDGETYKLTSVEREGGSTRAIASIDGSLVAYAAVVEDEEYSNIYLMDLDCMGEEGLIEPYEYYEIVECAVDNDGGDDSSIASSIEDPYGFSFEDTCGYTLIEEGVCGNDDEFMTLNYYCGSCSSGVCSGSESAANCGGDVEPDPTTYGYINYHTGVSYGIADTCVDDTYLAEVYCGDEYIETVYYYCNAGCEDGACVVCAGGDDCDGNGLADSIDEDMNSLLGSLTLSDYELFTLNMWNEAYQDAKPSNEDNQPSLNVSDWAIAFDGDDYLDYDNSDGRYSASHWLIVDAELSFTSGTSADKETFVILGRSTDDGDGLDDDSDTCTGGPSSEWWFQKTANGYVRYAQYIDSSNAEVASTNGATDVDETYGGDDEGYYHFTGIWNGSASYLYVDGILVDTNTDAISLVDPSGEGMLRIGSGVCEDSEFTGSIKSLTIWGSSTAVWGSDSEASSAPALAAGEELSIWERIWDFLVNAPEAASRLLPF